jgi:hypothetical protein
MERGQSRGAVKISPYAGFIDIDTLFAIHLSIGGSYDKVRNQIERDNELLLIFYFTTSPTNKCQNTTYQCTDIHQQTQKTGLWHSKDYEHNTNTTRSSNNNTLTHTLTPPTDVPGMHHIWIHANTAR